MMISSTMASSPPGVGKRHGHSVQALPRTIAHGRFAFLCARRLPRRSRGVKSLAQRIAPHSPKSPNQKRMPPRPVQPHHIHARLPLRRINQLPHPQQRRPARHAQQFRRLQIRRGRIYLLIRISQLHAILMLECHKKRPALQSPTSKRRKFIHRQIACLQSKRLIRSLPHAFQHE